MKRFVMWLWVNNITTGWGGVPNGTLSMMLTCCPNLMFLAFPWLEIQRFQIGHFASLRSSKLIFILLSLSKSKLPLFVPFYYCGQVIVTLLSLGKTCREKQSKPSPFDKNSRTTQNIWHKLFPMIQSAGIKN